jgi:hypothetical protein
MRPNLTLSITVVTTLLGRTVIGWIVALAWSLSNPQQVLHRDSGHHVGIELLLARN